MRILTMLLMVLVLFTLTNAQTAAELLAAGDAAYDGHDNEVALKNYLAAYNADAQSCDAAWKTSRAYSDIGDEKEAEAERRDNFQKAEDMARKAIALCPNSDMAHLQLSIAIGRVALMAGKKEQVQLSQAVKDEAEKAIELNPNNDTAHHVYARWHRKVATLSGVQKTFAKILYGGLPPASLEQAEEHFKKAIELKPDHINHHLELGITYEEMKEWKKANEEYKIVASLPVVENMDSKYKAQAAEQQQAIAGKLQ